jgi:hypothetical protein
MSEDLREIVRQYAAIYMGKPYDELGLLVGKKEGNYFVIEYKAKKYEFEVYATFFEKDKIRVMVSAQPHSFLGWLSGYAIYFGKTINNQVIKSSENPNVIF